MTPALTAEALPEAVLPRTRRLTSVDAVRGLIMIVMALDHTRDLVGFKPFNATDLTKTTVLYFFTRWITHFCAPGFMLLAGTGAFLSRRERPALSAFLVSRGLWLVFAELTIINFAWTYAFTRPGLAVIWALGWSMVILAALIWLPRVWVGVIAVGTIALHNALDGLKVGSLVDSAGNLGGTAGDWALSVLHQQNRPVLYPLVPWFAVMALGYLLGPIFKLEALERRRTLLRLGWGMIGAFLALRATNLYGDASRWSVQPDPVFTVLSFLNTTKYPPSLLYLLMTLGPLCLLLAGAEGLRGGLERALVVFGRVPFFYYVLHLALLHGVAIVVGVAQGFPVEKLLGPFFRFPAEFGLSLGWVYVLWLSAIAVLYVPCRAFAALKARRSDWWLSYL